MVGDDAKQLVLDCYRLARWYHQCPDVFLSMPLSDVQMHMIRTVELARIMQRTSSDDA
jgi:hypothetical protein